MKLTIVSSIFFALISIGHATPPSPCALSMSDSPFVKLTRQAVAEGVMKLADVQPLLRGELRNPLLAQGFRASNSAYFRAYELLLLNPTVQNSWSTTIRAALGDLVHELEVSQGDVHSAREATETILAPHPLDMNLFVKSHLARLRTRKGDSLYAFLDSNNRVAVYNIASTQPLWVSPQPALAAAGAHNPIISLYEDRAGKIRVVVAASLPPENYRNMSPPLPKVEIKTETWGLDGEPSVVRSFFVDTGDSVTEYLHSEDGPDFIRLANFHLVALNDGVASYDLKRPSNGMNSFVTSTGQRFFMDQAHKGSVHFVTFDGKTWNETEAFPVNGFSFSLFPLSDDRVIVEGHTTQSGNVEVTTFSPLGPLSPESVSLKAAGTAVSEVKVFETSDKRVLVAVASEDQSGRKLEIFEPAVSKAAISQWEFPIGRSIPEPYWFEREGRVYLVTNINGYSVFELGSRSVVTFGTEQMGRPVLMTTNDQVYLATSEFSLGKFAVKIFALFAKGLQP